MKKSVWQDEVSLTGFEKLEGDKNTDVLIIGGGICGILCAHLLKEAGVDYILAEGSRIASGITKNTTAKITSQHGLIYHKLTQDMGSEKAKMYLDANNNALKNYESLCKNMDCDFETKDAYTYSTTDRKKIEKEVNAVNSLGFKAEFAEKTELPFATKGAIRFKNQAQFNPFKFIKEITKGLNIFENTFIRDIATNVAISDNGKITAKKIIVTTHFPFINKHGSYFLKLYQHRSYVSAFSGAQQLSGMYVDEDLKGLSFRTYKDLLLIGGGSHRTGKNGGAWGEIQEFATKYYPQSVLKYEWATQDCMSLDGVPYIGKYSKNTPNLYVASGFNKWGMTSSMVAAKILCDMVLEKQNDFCEVFSPDRSILKPQLFVNGVETTVNLLTPTVKRCPHLGCALKWNKAEHTWDCPCHGSRFEENGKLIDNPSTGDANIK
ncbi:MAG: FAD-dependent oxidoreductase [Clostridia bacterium]|nr:FAD-dependent oxidoreductase [Clostridia bacterium]